jgi:anthranilate/para-aminobenzoate synthase component II
VTDTGYQKYKSLREFFNIVAYSYNSTDPDHDKTAFKYVAAVEAKNYPIYGTQFHPEMVIY